jgi:soluble lytic murein transglycosylase-like protein
MLVNKTVRLGLATFVLVAAGASAANAEIVFLTSGRTVSVKSHVTAGDTMVLTLRSGGEVTLDKSLIDRIEADEVPHPEPVAAQNADQALPLAQSPAEGSSLLRETAYAGLILAAAEAHGVDPVLVQALIQVESNYKPRARSAKGAMGLMQLMPSTAREYQVRNAYDPAANISAGVQKLKGLLDKWGGDVRLALASYNAGEGAVARFNGIPPYRETQKYVSKILSIAGLR